MSEQAPENSNRNVRIDGDASGSVIATGDKNVVVQLFQRYYQWKYIWWLTALVLLAIGVSGYLVYEKVEQARQQTVNQLRDPHTLAASLRKEIEAAAEAQIAALPQQPGRGAKIAEIERQRDMQVHQVADFIRFIQEGLQAGSSEAFQRATEILQQEGIDAALAYLGSRRPSTLEVARRQAERAEAQKEQRNHTLHSLLLEANLRETKLDWPAALALREQVAELAPDWFKARSYLGMLLYKLASYREAEPHLRAALALAANPTEKSTALNNLAQLLQDTNHLAEAEPLMRRALAISEQSRGADHPRVATRLNNLGQLLRDTNRPAQAELLMRRALAIDEQSYGAEHPKVAIDLNNLALLLWATNRREQADPLMRRALAIGEQSLGAEHVWVANPLNNLAKLLRVTKRLPEAEPLMRRALAIDEQSYGPEHAHVASVLNNLALLLQDTDRLAEAEPLMRRALAIEEQSYGAEHPDVAIHLNNLALLLQDTTRLAEAEPLMRRMAAIYHRFHQRTGHEHPSSQVDLQNYRLLLEAMEIPSDEIEPRVQAAMETAGTLEPIGPEVERLLGAAKPVAEVLAALDEQYQEEGKPPIYFLPPDQPITPHLDEVLGAAKSAREALDELDRQYREQGKPAIWFLPLNEPISPHVDELLGSLEAKDE